MRLLALLLVALALAACASAPPNDGIPRVLVDGEWVIPGHTHGDDTLHRSCPGLGPDGQPKPGGCAADFERGVLHVVSSAIERGRAAQPASVAPVSSPKEAPK